MVKILENTETIESQEEHKSRLVGIVKDIFPEAIINSPFGGEFGIFFEDDDERKPSSIYVYPNRNYIRVIDKKRFDVSMLIAEEYEKRGEPEFTIKKDY